MVPTEQRQMRYTFKSTSRTALCDLCKAMKARIGGRQCKHLFVRHPRHTKDEIRYRRICRYAKTPNSLSAVQPSRLAWAIHLYKDCPPWAVSQSPPSTANSTYHVARPFYTCALERLPGRISPIIQLILLCREYSGPVAHRDL